MIQAKPLTEEQLMHIESLVRSPVYGALKALLDTYRTECLSVLMTAKEPQKIYETQGRLIGLNVIENLPKVRALQEEAKRQKAKEEESKKEPKHVRRSERKGD